MTAVSKSIHFIDLCRPQPPPRCGELHERPCKGPSRALDGRSARSPQVRRAPCGTRASKMQVGVDSWGRTGRSGRKRNSHLRGGPRPVRRCPPSASPRSGRRASLLPHDPTPHRPRGRRRSHRPRRHAPGQPRWTDRGARGDRRDAHLGSERTRQPRRSGDGGAEGRAGADTRTRAGARGDRPGPVRRGDAPAQRAVHRARGLGRARGPGRPPRRPRGRRRPRTREARRHRRGDGDHGHRHARSARALREPGPDGRRSAVARDGRSHRPARRREHRRQRRPPAVPSPRRRPDAVPHAAAHLVARGPRHPGHGRRCGLPRPDRPAGPRRPQDRLHGVGRGSRRAARRRAPRAGHRPASRTRSAAAEPRQTSRCSRVRSDRGRGLPARQRSDPDRRSPLGPPPPRRRRALLDDLGAHLHRQLGRRHLQPRNARARRDLLEDLHPRSDSPDGHPSHGARHAARGVLRLDRPLRRGPRDRDGETARPSS